MRANEGFSLLELILVMVIMGILAGMVAFAVAGRGNQAREVRARADLSVYQNAIEAYALEHQDKYPKSLSDLAVPNKAGRSYIQQIKPDGWGEQYVYAYPGKKNKYDLYSMGADRISGTEDDISVWDIDTGESN
ncbi:MAG: type II secretion system major pseudopilin GspG [Candidatus Hydrogenedentes bacterium]|nr:type II secretion system major pseudopilin GspG [Candidatus Hydrogenedentota bacterium]